MKGFKLKQHGLTAVQTFTEEDIVKLKSKGYNLNNIEDCLRLLDDDAFDNKATFNIVEIIGTAVCIVHNEML